MHADQIAELIVDRFPGLTAMQLQKLLYYSQAWHLAITDQPLFEEPVQAWADGPVVYDVWRARKSYPSRLPHEHAPVELGVVSAGVVELVCDRYGNMSGDELSRLTHSEKPWLEARDGVPAGSRARKPISHESMADFYRQQDLGGRAPEDLAAGGIHTREPLASERFDIDVLLAGIAEAESEHDGHLQVSYSANRGEDLDRLDYEGIRTSRRGQ